MRTDLLRSFAVLCVLAVTFGGHILAGDGDLKGRVEDGTGKPLHEVVVQVMLAGEYRPLSTALTDHEGRFSFPDLPEGSLEVVASQPGLETVTTVVSPEDRSRELVIVLSSGLPRVASEISVFGAIPRSAASASTFRAEEFSRRALEDPGQVLRVIPGLTVIQHAGGGKSNQYLIRGFDADHGTDFAISFAGIPVNVVSHAHGQGYADLSFVIPETLATIDVYKGPYFAELGNLATAGAAIFQLKEQFDESFLKLQGGQFGTGRVLLGLSPKTDWTRGFLAIEGNYTNGPFLNAQVFKRLNFATRWTFDLPSNQSLSVLGTGYEGKWNASGQIPLREVQAGRLDRFGAIDPSEGGTSSRYNFAVSHQKLWADSALNSQFYAVHYDLSLFTNFTFVLKDPVRGDGVNQTDNREIVGGHLQYHHHHHLDFAPAIFTAGFDYRQDFADVGLFRQQQRTVFENVLRSDIDERNVGFYAQEKLDLHPTFSAIFGVRHDRFRFGVKDRLASDLQGEQYRSFTGPKVSLVYLPWRPKGPQLFLNYGRGFHSNDSRSVVANPSEVALAAADGYEAGYRQIFGDRLELSLAYWLLDLEAELTWLGDRGTTEFSGATRRHGPEVELKWKIGDFLFVNGGAFYSRSHVRGSGEMIPRAPRLALNGGVSFGTRGGFSGDLQVRHLGRHPLNEDGLVQAEPYTLADLSLYRTLSDHWQIIVTVLNLFDADVKEAQTYFRSRLPFETGPVADNHYNPGYPFTLRVGFQYTF